MKSGGARRTFGAAALGSWLSVSSSCLWACRSPQPESPLGSASELPVTRVVLYQNGVGYFERSGTVDSEVLTLQVRPSQINDLLKSLTVIDRGSGRAVSASLPLEESADRALSELPEQVRNAGGLLDVLRLFRGARVEIQGARSARAFGRVIGVENLEPSGGEVKADWRVSLKTADDEVVVFAVNEIKQVTLHDATLSVGLERSLDVSLGEGGWKPIALAIRLAGESPHRVLASYIVEMPRWKPAYRLVLREGEQPLLQGWAVVDNVSGEHWQDVSLSLVSGSPISFKYNLHAPQYTERADLTPAWLPRAAAPPPAEAPGYAASVAQAPPPAPPPMTPSPAPRYEKSKRGARPSPAEPAAEGYGYEYKEEVEESEAGADDVDAPEPDLDAALESQGGQAESSNVGALFRYDIKDRVTIPDRSSTLVSIVNQRIAGEEVMYFRPELASGSGEIHPYRAVKFENATGFTLEKGPITVYANGTFVGEGFVERMESGAVSFLTFAIDGKVSLDEHGGTREEGMALRRIVGGQLVTEAQRVQVTTYEVKNRRDDAVRAFIRSLKQPGWTLKLRPAGSTETPEAVILPLDVPAGASAKLDVEWVQPVTRNVAIDSSNASELLDVYLQGGKAPPAVAQAIRAVLAVKAEIDDKRREEQRLGVQHAALSRDTERVRENLNVLRRTQGNQALQLELAKKLGKLEQDLGVLSGRQVVLSEAIAELEARLRVLIKDVTLEAQ